ncbi:MAG: FkbM family methyltransferase [Verrucomicrobia bacterium]|nr:FkbM family methyltransferase [Verrucomicrobiota bacterium]
MQILPPLKQTWGEVFEPAIADLYKIAQASPDLIIDVGANIGAFACRAAFLHRSATVHAFEPSEKHVQMLEENIRLNGLTNVTVHRAAVTKDGRDVLFSALGTGGGSGIFLHEGGSPVAMQSTTLATVDIQGAQSLFVKLDCEGAEGEIIDWLCSHRAQLPPRVQIACELHHWCPIPIEQMIGNLQLHGFAVQEAILFDESYLFASV